MTKKEYITLFLDKVKDVREPARGFVILMRYEILNDEQIEQLFALFRSIVSGMSDLQKKQRLEQSLAKLQLLRNKESGYETKNLEPDLDAILSAV